MIDLGTYILFIGASLMLCIVPGPDMAFLLGRTLAQGRKAGVLAAIGFNLGGWVHLAASVIGLSATLAASSTAFTLVKSLGGCYLAWIGVQAIISAPAIPKADDRKGDHRPSLAILWQGFLSDVLNPKVALFFLSFLPQFVEVGASDETMQLLLLGATLNAIAIIFNLTLVWFASAATTRLRERGEWAAWLNRAMGATFILLGVRLFFEKP